LTVTGGQLNFSTGPEVSSGGGTTYFSTAGSSISITATSTSPANFSGTLLTGTLTGTAELISAGGGVFEITETAVFTPTSPAVAAYFGDPTGLPYYGTLVITFQPGVTNVGGGIFEGGGNGGFISSGNIGVTPTPVPSGIVLVSCGALCLLGCVWVRRKPISGGAIA
jgi:hypothetical protein